MAIFNSYVKLPEGTHLAFQDGDETAPEDPPKR